MGTFAQAVEYPFPQNAKTWIALFLHKAFIYLNINFVTLLIIFLLFPPHSFADMHVARPV